MELRTSLRQTAAARRKHAFTPYLFVLPAMIVIFAFIIYPLIMVFRESMLKDSLLSAMGAQFVGLDNYRELLHYPNMGTIAGHSVIWMGLGTGFTLLGGLLVGLLLSNDWPLNRLLRGVIMIPWVLPVVVSATVFRWMLNSESGIINRFLQVIGMIGKGIPWLGVPSLAMLSVVLVIVWRLVPLASMIVLGAVQAISKNYYEAASIDGASSWKQFWHITLPFLRSSLVYIFLINLIWITNNIVLILVMTNGGPNSSTETVATFVYRLAFDSFNFGLSNALGVVNALFTLLITGIYLIVFRKSWLVR